MTENRNWSLPDDDLGRSWLSGHFESTADIKEKSVIVTLMSVDDELVLEVIGAAFIVSTDGETAVCICAAHSLEVVKAANNRGKPATGWQMPPDTDGSRPEYIDFDRVTGVINIEGELVRCKIYQVNYVFGTDIALISIVEVEGRSVFKNKIALTFDIPEVGSEVAILTNTIKKESVDGSRGSLSLEFHMRIGVVTGVEYGKRIPGQSMVFFTTIPTLGGMSGSPVLLRPAPGSDLIACGVVSSDLSPEESHSSFLVAGHSAASMLWPSAGLAVESWDEVAESPKYMTLLELAKLGMVDNRTRRSIVTVSQSKRSTVIQYLDHLHGKLVVNTAGHPASSE